MLKKSDFVKIINDCKASGYEVKVRDVMFCLLKNVVDDSEIIYNSLFGQGDDVKFISNYEKSKPIKFLDKYVKANYPNTDNKKKSNTNGNNKEEITYDDISFEENKDAIIKMIAELKEKYNEGKIEYKDYAKIVADLRIKLNDKFGASEKSDEQRIVVVPQKCDFVCPKTRTECYQLKKEYAMELFGLIEDPNKNTGSK